MVKPLTNPERSYPRSLQSLLADSERYEEFLSYLQSGAGFPVACHACRINPDLARRWVERGQQSARGSYRRFMDDVANAVAKGYVIAEATVKDRNPMQWLARSPTRSIIDSDPNPWSDKPPVHQPSTPDTSNTPPVLDISAILPAILKQYEECGLITVHPEGQGLLGQVKSDPSTVEEDGRGA